MLELKNIRKSYKTDSYTQNALDGVSLAFRKCEFVAILGPSGSGKTTLLNVIGGLDRYDDGDLIINGKKTKKFKDKDWDAYRNNCIGFVFQNYNLINHISVLENVEMGMTLSGINSRKRKKLAVDDLENIGLKNHIYKKPNQLSGGQMQRVAIARALVNNPDIILADEPTGALDSKNSIKIMQIIKEIANEKLVIMVTHNRELAEQYATRVIELKDGKIMKDSNPINNNEEQKEYKIKKTSMNYFTALSLSFNNIKTKKGRTILTAFASSIGIIGIALILSLSNGFDKQIDKFEADTLSTLPVYVSTQEVDYDEEKMEEKTDELMGTINGNKKFVTTDYANVVDLSEIQSVHYNNIDENYINYVENIDSSLITGITYYRMTGLNMLYKNNNKVSQINTNDIYLTAMPKELNDTKSYLKDGYDLLEGKMPKNKYELVISINEKNEIDKSLIKSLGFDAEKIKFKDLVNKEFKIVLNDDYYQKYNGMYLPNSDYNKLYINKNNIVLKIVGIVRPKEENKLALMTSMFTSNTGISGVSSVLYANDLIEDIIKINSNSKIVKEQNKKDYNVMSGINFTTEEEKDQIKTYLGADDKPFIIALYPVDFVAKDNITTYLDKYNLNKEKDDQVIYTDLASSITEMSGSIMDAITIVLVAFSAISLIVSSIMIGIITYISVLERTKEIGILRALGARKKDITRVFNAETVIIGLFSGLIGIIIARLLLIPANAILLNLTDLENVAILNPLHALILIIISMILTIIGGLIPAKIASKKDPVEALRTE